MNATVKKVHNKARRQELRNDDSYIHIMKYMGSKRELLPDIKKAIQQMVPKNSTILDIFAGTASVGAYLKKDYNIISNDIQNYSQIIAKSLIESSSIELTEDIHHTIFMLEKEYLKNKEKLIKLFSKTYDDSNFFVDIKKGEWTDKLREDYLQFTSKFPSPSNKFKTSQKELTLLKDLYFSKDKSTYLQTVFLFSETYFSLEQAMDIDSVRYAIDMVIEDEVLKSVFLSALIYAYSYCSSGTGHFAMFRDLKDLSSIEDTFIYRKKRVWEYFLKKLDQIIEYHQYIPDKTYKTVSYDFSELLNSSEIKDTDLIYADPPYSFVHYSRFYHAIESLVKYDYDIPSFKGRYRSDRHQSPFCQKTNVTDAFRSLFEGAKKNNSHVLLSYSDTGMISLGEITTLLKEIGFKSKVEQIQYDHSTLGRKGHKNNTINEYLIQATLN
ncbi:MAG: DNA adenine methylase [Sulfurovum sp.]|nr:DNA adenine methylase [Sulfurovum sp.]